MTKKIMLPALKKIVELDDPGFIEQLENRLSLPQGLKDTAILHKRINACAGDFYQRAQEIVNRLSNNR